MTVNNQIGYFKSIVNISTNAALSHDINIHPSMPMQDTFTDHTTLKPNIILDDTYGASGVMHWFSHNWGDVDNVVGA